MAGDHRVEASTPANCDICDLRPGVRSVTAYGIETWACTECLGEEAEDDLSDEEQVKP